MLKALSKLTERYPKATKPVYAIVGFLATWLFCTLIVASSSVPTHEVGKVSGVLGLWGANFVVGLSLAVLLWTIGIVLRFTRK